MDYCEALSSLQELIEKPERHDSPIGVLSRMYIKQFIQKHRFDQVDEQKIVQITSERIFNLMAKKVQELEQKILSKTDDQDLIKQIQWAQNERRIEAGFRKELLENH